MADLDHRVNDDTLHDWCYPDGPGIIRSYGLPLSSGTYTNGDRYVPLPTEWKPINSIQTVAEVRDLKRKLEELETRLTKLEAIRIKEFKENDIYEVNKRIERIERNVALIASNFVNNRITRFFFRIFKEAGDGDNADD